MANVVLEPKYEILADELLDRFQERDIVLTDYAKALIRLSVEAWYEDTPRGMFRQSSYLDLRRFAEQIVEETLQDAHIIKRGRARYIDVLAALSDSGQRVLRDFLDKGF